MIASNCRKMWKRLSTLERVKFVIFCSLLVISMEYVSIVFLRLLTWKPEHQRQSSESHPEHDVPDHLPLKDDVSLQM